MLNYPPEPWTPEHSILVSRLMAWELNLAWWTDITYGEIGSRVGPARLKEIIPSYPDSLSASINGSAMKKSMADLRPLLDVARSYRAAFGLGSLEAGAMRGSSIRRNRSAADRSSRAIPIWQCRLLRGGMKCISPLLDGTSPG
jgi:acyl-homoserine lactone acylase PvdQ